MLCRMRTVCTVGHKSHTIVCCGEIANATNRRSTALPLLTRNHCYFMFVMRHVAHLPRISKACMLNNKCLWKLHNWHWKPANPATESHLIEVLASGRRPSHSPAKALRHTATNVTRSVAGCSCVIRDNTHSDWEGRPINVATTPVLGPPRRTGPGARQSGVAVGRVMG